MLGLFCLINQGDRKVLGANELACGGVQRGVVLAGALTRCDFERRGEHGPVQTLGCAVLVENLCECLRLGLVIFREAFAINEAVAVAVLEGASAANDQQATGGRRRDQCAVCVNDRLRGGAATARDGNNGDVVVVDDVDQCRGVCKVDAVGGGAFGCLTGAGVGVDPMAAGDCFCCGACADIASAAVRAPTMPVAPMIAMFMRGSFRVGFL